MKMLSKFWSWLNRGSFKTMGFFEREAQIKEYEIRKQLRKSYGME